MAKKRKAKRFKREIPVQNVANTGPLGAVGAGSSGTWYFNCAHIMSMLNRKAFHQITRSGHLKTYGVEVQVFNMVNGSSGIYGAPLGYPTYNAVRAWHFARKERYEEAGFSLSDLGYGERFRFALDKVMSDLNQSTSTTMLRPSHLDNTVDESGEWDWSDVIVTPPVNPTDTGGIEAEDLSNSFILHLTGDHTAATGAGGETFRYTHVGIIQSWTENRRGWAAPSAEEAIQPVNPLAFARLSETSSYELTAEVTDEQKQSPPYSNTDDDDAESVFAALQVLGQLETKFPNPTTNNDMVILPGGVGKIIVTNNDSASSYPMISLRIYELD